MGGGSSQAIRRIRTLSSVTRLGSRVGDVLTVVLNLIWLVLAGLWLAVTYALSGLALMITIIGIPFGIQAFKLAGFALWPVGRAVVPTPGSSPVR